MSDISARNRRPLRVGLIGWGAIAHRFARLIGERDAGRIVIVGVARRSDGTGDPDAGLPAGAVALCAPADIGSHGVDVVVEAAGRAAVAEWGPAALAAADAFVVASTSAFADTALLDGLVGAAEAHGSRILIPPGALAGIEALAAASALALDTVVHRIIKPPAAWRGTAAEALVALDGLEAATTFFSGTAREAAERFPQNANVAVISALAGIGLDRTRVDLVADPAVSGNRHHLSASGSFGRMEADIENRPLATNPKSSEMAALSLVRLVENLARPLAL